MKENNVSKEIKKILQLEELEELASKFIIGYKPLSEEQLDAYLEIDKCRKNIIDIKAKLREKVTLLQYWENKYKNIK